MKLIIHTTITNAANTIVEMDKLYAVMWKMANRIEVKAIGIVNEIIVNNCPKNGILKKISLNSVSKLNIVKKNLVSTIPNNITVVTLNAWLVIAS